MSISDCVDVSDLATTVAGISGASLLMGGATSAQAETEEDI